MFHSGPASSSPFGSDPPTPASPVPTSSPELKTLQHADYPQVKHWVRKRGDNTQISVIKVVDKDDFNEGDSSDDGDAGNDDPNQEDGVLAFLEMGDGKLISYDEKKRLYSSMRGFWNDHIDHSKPPVNWSSAGESLRNSFRNVLESKFSYLRLCSGHWKVEELWKRNYHSWLRSFRRRNDDNASRKRKQHNREFRPDENEDPQHAKKNKGKNKGKSQAIAPDSEPSDTDELYARPKPRIASAGPSNSKLGEVVIPFLSCWLRQ